MASSTESWTFSGSYSMTCEAALGEAVAAAVAAGVEAVALDEAAAEEAAVSEDAAAAEVVLGFPFFFLVKGTLTASSIQ